MVLSSGTGEASFGVLRGAASSGLLLEVLFVLETRGGQSLHVDRFLPNTPLRVVVDHSGNLVTDLYSVEAFDRQLIPGQIDALIDNKTLTETLLPNMIAAATKFSEVLGAAEISNGLHKMNLTLDHEIDRLKSLHKKNNHIRPEEIRVALEEQTSLVSLMRDAQIRMDSLQLIWKGDF